MKMYMYTYVYHNITILQQGGLGSVARRPAHQMESDVQHDHLSFPGIVIAV